MLPITANSRCCCFLDQPGCTASVKRGFLPSRRCATDALRHRLLHALHVCVQVHCPAPLVGAAKGRRHPAHCKPAPVPPQGGRPPPPLLSVSCTICTCVLSWAKCCTGKHNSSCCKLDPKIASCPVVNRVRACPVLALTTDPMRRTK
jgi:hypothetical protein